MLLDAAGDLKIQEYTTTDIIHVGFSGRHAYISYLLKLPEAPGL